MNFLEEMGLLEGMGLGSNSSYDYIIGYCSKHNINLDKLCRSINRKIYYKDHKDIFC